MGKELERYRCTRCSLRDVLSRCRRVLALLLLYATLSAQAGTVVTDVNSLTPNGTYVMGATISIRVTFSANVNVTGTPRLTLETGLTDVQVNYTSGSGSAILIFNYTVAAGQNSLDLDYISTAALSLNGGTIRDTGLNGAVLTLPAPGAAGSLGLNKNFVIRTAPVVLNVTSTVTDGRYRAGAVVPITVQFNKVVNVVGLPQLRLVTPSNTGVVYTTGSGTDTLTFNYTVLAAHSSADLTYFSTASLSVPGGATIRDAFNTNAVRTLPAIGAAGSLSFNKAILIDNVVPTVTGVSSPAANGTYGLNAVVPITVTFSEAVNVTGAPTLTLETGTSDAVVSYTSGSGTATLTFNYTVAAGHISLDLNYVATTSLALAGGSTIQDTASPGGNTATLTLPGLAAAGSLGTNKNLVIDSIPPTVNSVSSINANGIYTVGASLVLTVTFSEAVTVSGVPQLTLATGGAGAVASYVGGTGTATLQFQFTVALGQNSNDLDYLSTTALSLNAGTITDMLALNNAVLTLPVPGAANSLGALTIISLRTPQITIRETIDSDGNGQIDAIRIVTDVNLFDDFTALTMTVTLPNYALNTTTPFDTGLTANDNEFFIRLIESGVPDTGITPTVRVTSGGNVLLQGDAGIVALDRARPVLLSALWTDASGGGVSATDTIVLTFSERVRAPSVTIAASALLGLPVANDSLSISSIGQQGPATTLLVSLNATVPLPIQLTPGGIYSPGSITEASPSGVYILPVGGSPDPLGNANVLDVAGNYAHVQSFGTAVDLGPTAQVLAVAWNDLTTNAREWLLPAAVDGVTYNASASVAAPGLIVRNVGNIRIKLNVSCSATAAPAGWSLASSAATDKFAMRLLNGMSNQDLATGPKLLRDKMFSGYEQPFDLQLTTPDELTTGHDVEQTILITIVATPD